MSYKHPMEEIISQVMRGDIPHALGEARISVNAAVCRAIECQKCHSHILDQETAVLYTVKTKGGEAHSVFCPTCADDTAVVNTVVSCQGKYLERISRTTWEGETSLWKEKSDEAETTAAEGE